MPTPNDLSKKRKADAIRVLSMDAIQRANSGHPGAPMGMADIAEVLWSDHLRHNPANPAWADRDRFVLSNGHGSMLLYALLHLTGYQVSLDDIKCFRQLHSITPGHPESGLTPGVETTTGPLGQGIANAVGMAISERLLASEFNRDGFALVDHHTFVFAGDGCLMEGISHEACSLAGTLALGKLIVFWDDNGISIDGPVSGWFTDNTPDRFRAYGWQVIEGVDGHDSHAIAVAVDSAKDNDQQPTLICCRTLIGFGSPNKEGQAASHGAPLGAEEVALTRKRLEWPWDEAFHISDELYRVWNAEEAGREREAAWRALFDRYGQRYPELAAEFERRINGKLPVEFPEIAARLESEAQGQAQKAATRKASQLAIEGFARHLPELIGGSADLTGSNLTRWSGSRTITAAPEPGNYLFYGVREFGMAAIMNGIALHGGFIPYGGTFLIFSEYARNAVRMAALMKQRVIFVFTHDSIGLGEDGPTHQAVEQLSTLRLIPGMQVWRPCDTLETVVAWRYALENRRGPTCLNFSRQSVAFQERNSTQIREIKRGAYILRHAAGEVEVVVVASGSEVQLAGEVVDRLTANGLSVQLVSMPSTTVFDQQDVEYKNSILPDSAKLKVVIEAGVADLWYKYVGLDGLVFGVNTFGESAPGDAVYEHFGLTADAITNAVCSRLGV